MIGKKEAKRILKMVFEHSKADQVEVSIFNNQQSLTRFANNYIHQNVNETNSSISIRAIFGKKIGFASTNALDSKKIKSTLRWAEKIAGLQRENNDFTSLPLIKRDRYQKVDAFSKKTAAVSTRDRANAVAMIIDTADKYSLKTFGSVSNGIAEICIGNSLGTFAYAKCGDVFCNIVMAGDDSTGYVQKGARDIDSFDFKKLAQTAAQKAVLCANPVDLPPGQYTTIFEPLAAHEFLDYLGYYAFNGKVFNEGRSFLCGKIGKKIVDERITIIDDSFLKKGFTFPFDFEGVPKKSLVLINKGIARNVVHDSLTATRANKRSTGHGLSAPNPFGPVPTNLALKGGQKSVDQLIKETKKGILVTRFHYTNIIDPYRLIFTGMTRDGTFLIEDGIITKGIKNFRFTENVIDCFNRIGDIGRQTTLVAADPGYGGRFAIGTITPAIKIKDFDFTSSTEF
jgi:PmbA protein